MKFYRSFLVVLVLALAGCSDPLPPSKQKYAGEWRSDNMLLIITQDGRVVYKRKKGNSNVSIDAPIKEFIEDDFVVGFAWLTTRFEVSQTPQLNDEDIWQMTVDGVLLTKSN